MAEEINISNSIDKAEKYRQLLPQISALVEPEPYLIANLANIAAALKQTFEFFWIGFYLVRNDELVLGPFQGPVACTRIQKGRGVCGTSWAQKETILVDDVENFPGHIACSAMSRSEIVVPVFNSSGEVAMVIDVDSDQLAFFDQIDCQYLEGLAKIISGLIEKGNNRSI
ncbi:MAG: GAF domain-containing protein [Bacteroidetes bacterium]|nr:GAF domain-containing protein [Bacteroidota bacterium]